MSMPSFWKRTLAFFALGTFFVGGAARAADDPRDPKSRFGVLDFLSWDHDWNAHHYGGDKPARAAALMKEAGVAMVRTDFLWSDIEPEEGRFDFAKHDRLVETLDAQGIKILALLHYNSAWAKGGWNAPPDADAFARYARETVKRYKGKVRYWEIWNEPDQATYWTPQDDMKGYAALLKKVYPAIKAEDPTAVVVLGGLSGGAVFPLKRVYQNGGGPYFDVINIHPFVDPLGPDPVGLMRGVYRGVKKIATANGDAEKPIWITEIGCPGTKDPNVTANWWLGPNPSEETQAKWVRKVYAETKKWGAGEVFWAFFRDTHSHFGTGTDYFGLLREDFSKKPAFEAYKQAAAEG